MVFLIIQTFCNVLELMHFVFMVADKQIDLNNVDLKKLRVKQLKKILSDWDEDCVGCLEKSDFIKKIEMLKKEHTELWLVL